MITAIEWFSGTGGLHCALSRACSSLDMQYEVVMAVDISGISEQCYRHNFPNTLFLRKSIESIDASAVPSAVCWLMSPPCQPFVRGSRDADSDDTRNTALFHILSLLRDIPVEKRPRALFLENVSGIRNTDTLSKVMETLKICGYFTQEHVLSPAQYGIPNDRLRYYLLASTSPCTTLTVPSPSPRRIKEFIDENVSTEYYLTEQQFDVLGTVRTGTEQRPSGDVVDGDDITSSAFTKSYGAKWNHFRGIGSLYSERLLPTHDRFINVSRDMIGSIRYFTPTEISKLHAYPESYSFPPSMSNKNRWGLLGNGVNVHVCSVLLAHLLKSTIPKSDT